MKDQQPTLCVSATGVDEIESAVSGLALEVTRLSTESTGVAFTSTSVGDVGVLGGEFGFAIATAGDVAGDAHVVALQLEAGSGSWNGEEFALDRAWLYAPGSEHTGVGKAIEGGRPPRFATISLPMTAVGRQPSSPTFTTSRSPHVHTLRRMVLDVIGAAQRGTLDDVRARLVEREMIQVAHAITCAGATNDTAVTCDRTSATWITQECLVLAESMPPLPTSVDLAAQVGVSDRWVRAAFRQVYGVAPSTYFRVRAIEGARRELRSADPATTSVTDVATRWGFWHLGRFSASYRDLVGELPSDTLRRVG